MKRYYEDGGYVDADYSDPAEGFVPYTPADETFFTDPETGDVYADYGSSFEDSGYSVGALNALVSQLAEQSQQGVDYAGLQQLIDGLLGGTSLPTEEIAGFPPTVPVAAGEGNVSQPPTQTADNGEKKTFSPLGSNQKQDTPTLGQQTNINGMDPRVLAALIQTKQAYIDQNGQVVFGAKETPTWKSMLQLGIGGLGALAGIYGSKKNNDMMKDYYDALDAQRAQQMAAFNANKEAAGRFNLPNGYAGLNAASTSARRPV